MAERKDVRYILDKHGLFMKFSLRTVHFSGFGYEDCQTCRLKVPSYTQMCWEEYEKAKAELKPLRVILEHERVR